MLCFLCHQEAEDGETLGDRARRKTARARDRAAGAANEAEEGAKRNWFGFRVGARCLLLCRCDCCR